MTNLQCADFWACVMCVYKITELPHHAEKAHTHVPFDEFFIRTHVSARAGVSVLQVFSFRDADK